MGEKTLDPTEHKLEEARKKGQVPVSKTMASFLIITVGMEATFALEEVGRGMWMKLMDLALRSHTMDFEMALNGLLVSSTVLLGGMSAIFLLLNIVTATIGYWGQFGVLFSAHPLIPDINRINPKSMLEQLFTIEKLGETGNSILKLVTLGLLSYAVIRSELPAIVSLASGSPDQAYLGGLAILRGLFRYIMGALLVLSIFDLVLKRTGFNKQQRMDHEEVFREYKDNEGDPLVKAMRRSLAFQIMNSDPVKKTEKANAVVVNPTHFAVALFFDAKSQPVPLVCAKGANEIAQAMIRCAHARKIPVIRHVWLARTLFAVAKEDKVVPRTLFNPVALVYSVVEQLRLQGGTYCELDNTGRPPTEV